MHATAQPVRRSPGGLFQFLGAGAMLALAGCATLPDSAQERAEPHPQQVQFETTRGPVPTARSDAIIEKLEGGKGDSDLLDQHLAYEQAVNVGSPLVLGNKLTLLRNGPATYESMFAAIREAHDSINLETYIFDGGDAAQKFSELLLERQAAGVQVNIIKDGVGSLTTPAAFFDKLKAGGIKVLEFNPVNPLAGHRAGWLLNNRDHRRQLVIDGRVAFTGGVNISDTYSSAPSRERAGPVPEDVADGSTGWRDTHIRIEGPVVAEFQKLFMDTWARQKGEPLAERDYFPALQPQGDEIVRAIGSTSDDPQSLIWLTLMSAITQAQLKIELTIAYFAPDTQLLDALTGAAARGVQVSLVVPSHSDSWAIFNLGRSYYTQLLRGGVRIYERSGGVMHAKTACIDGVWSTIGSTNLDWRSFLHNDEINAVVLGRGFAGQMEALFADDLTQSKEITLGEWKKRSLLSRVKEQMARLGEYWL
jgi:cardiolipin synthase